MKNKTLYGVLLLALVGIIAIGATAMPFGGIFGGSAFNQAAQDAVKSDDYTSWKTAVSSTWMGMSGLIDTSQSAFQKQVDAYNAMQKQSNLNQIKGEILTAIKNNDYNAWITAVGKLDSPPSDTSQAQFDKVVIAYNSQVQQGTANKQAQTELQNAIKAGDYNAWKTAISKLSNPPAYADKITSDNFPTLVDLYNAMQSHDMTKVKADEATLGITNLGKMGLNGMHGDFGFDKQKGLGFGKGMGRHGKMFGEGSQETTASN